MAPGKCTTCDKTVYPLDPHIMLDGSAYHKMCAKCADCGCQITLSNFTKSGTTLLCKTHYFKRFHEEGSYLGGDKYSKVAPRDAKAGAAAEGESSEGVAAAAPAPAPAPVRAPSPAAVVEDAPASSSSSVAEAVESTSGVSAMSLKSRFEKKSDATAAAAEGEVKKAPAKALNLGSAAMKCSSCEKSIYPNDPKINLDGTAYHSACAKCADCGCQITLSNFTKSGTTLLCKTHYFKRFHEEGSYLGGDKFENKAPRDLKNASESGSESAATPAPTPAVKETVPPIPPAAAAAAPEPAPVQEAVVEAAPAAPVEQVADEVAAPEPTVEAVEEQADATPADTPAAVTSESESAATAESEPAAEEIVDASV